MFSIYVHFPFCLQKCHYCDFFSVPLSPDDEMQEKFAKSVVAEIDHLGREFNVLGRRVDSIFFGGGTPTLFDTRHLSTILSGILNRFATIPHETEISIEANPETLKKAKICELSKLFNRISIGIQSFDDKLLKILGRAHTSATAKRAIKLAKEAGFLNIGLDLMWGLPSQNLSALERDLLCATSFDVQHISAYQLTPENAEIAKWLKKIAKKSPIADEETQIKMMSLCENLLTSKGYEHYEISNFARKGHRCRHNENYWHYGEWLAAGPAAASFFHPETAACKNFVRITNINMIDDYLEQSYSHNREEIKPKEAMLEFCFMGLRTSDGLDKNAFKTLFGKSIETIYGKIFANWQKRFLAIDENGRLRLTKEGRLISNSLFEELA